MTDAKPYPKSQQLARGAKRYRRKVASPKQWQAIRAAKCRGQRCRVCLATDGVTSKVSGPTWIDAHHLIPRDRGGDDVADNIIGLCRNCHGGVEIREKAHCRLMLTRLTDAEYAYAINKAGEGVFERVYGIEYGR